MKHADSWASFQTAAGFLFLFFSPSQHKTVCTPAVSRPLVTTVKKKQTRRRRLWKCHIWWEAVKIFSVSPQDAGCPFTSWTAEDIHESYEPEFKIRRPSFGGGALNAILLAPSSVEMVNECLAEHNCSILCNDSNDKVISQVRISFKLNTHHSN